MWPFFLMTWAYFIRLRKVSCEQFNHHLFYKKYCWVTHARSHCKYLQSSSILRNFHGPQFLTKTQPKSPDSIKIFNPYEILFFRYTVHPQGHVGALFKKIKVEKFFTKIVVSPLVVSFFVNLGKIEWLWHFMWYTLY